MLSLHSGKESRYQFYHRVVFLTNDYYRFYLADLCQKNEGDEGILHLTEHSIGSYYYIQDPSGRVKIQQIGFWLEIWSKLIALIRSGIWGLIISRIGHSQRGIFTKNPRLINFEVVSAAARVKAGIV